MSESELLLEAYIRGERTVVASTETEKLIRYRGEITLWVYTKRVDVDDSQVGTVKNRIPQEAQRSLVKTIIFDDSIEEWYQGVLIDSQVRKPTGRLQVSIRL